MHPFLQQTGQERSVHTYARTLVKMVRICKITAKQKILKLKTVAIVIACSGSPKVVHLKAVFSESWLTALSLNFFV